MASAVTVGIDRLLRLDYPKSNSEYDLKQHEGTTVNALDMIEALKVMHHLFEDTREMIGNPMYRGEPEFDFIHDIKQAVEHYFLVGDDSKQSALRRRKNRSMVFLMLNPLVDFFQYTTHEEMLEQYNDIVDEAIQYIFDNNKQPSADDAFVIRHMISKDVAKRNKIQGIVDGIMRLRRRQTKRKK